MGALPPGSYCNPPTKRLCYPGHLSALPSLGLSFPIFRTRLVTDSSNLGPHGWKQCRTGLWASQRSCLFCQPKCQQGPVVSEVPPDKGRFAPRGRVGGRSAVPLPSASRGPPLWARRVGRFLLSHPAPPQPAGVSPSPRSPALTPFLGRSQHPGSDSCVRGRAQYHFMGGIEKALKKQQPSFGGRGEHGGRFAKSWPAESRPWGGSIVTGLSARNLHPLQEAKRHQEGLGSLLCLPLERGVPRAQR